MPDRPERTGMVVLSDGTHIRAHLEREPTHVWDSRSKELVSGHEQRWVTDWQTVRDEDQAS